MTKRCGPADVASSRETCSKKPASESVGAGCEVASLLRADQVPMCMLCARDAPDQRFRGIERQICCPGESVCPPGSVLACCDAFDVALALHVVRHAIRRRESSVWVCIALESVRGAPRSAVAKVLGKGRFAIFWSVWKLRWEKSNYCSF
mmetsp:Transcript_10190/g.26289  ORF Transcript_10190/g.26289 Transcript_10190/m.26289 type:complete len:149 (+) Transcript_10190:233-679(+)